MGRKPRLIVENGIYHVISRGINETEIFKEENDFKFFLQILIEDKAKNNVSILSYCLMNTHYHLLIKINNPNLSQFIQILNTKYAKHFNSKNFRLGNLFMNRFKSYYIDNEGYLLNVSRYIHLNPVEANIVKKPEEYKWSSFKEIINNEKKFVDTEELLSLTSTNCQTYKNYVEDIISFYSSLELDSFYKNNELKNYLSKLEKIFGNKIFENKYLRDIVIKYLVDKKFNIDEIKKIFNISKEQISRIKSKMDKKLNNDLISIKYYENFLRKAPLIEE
ncbi:MAG: transposase [Caldisericia bacterium]